MADTVFYPDNPEGLAMVAAIEEIAARVVAREANEAWAIHYPNCRCASCR